MKKLLGKIISKLYWKFGRDYDDSEFWQKVVLYHVPNNIVAEDSNEDIGQIIVAQINEQVELEPIQRLRPRAEDLPKVEKDYE